MGICATCMDKNNPKLTGIGNHQFTKESNPFFDSGLTVQTPNLLSPESLTKRKSKNKFQKANSVASEKVHDKDFLSPPPKREKTHFQNNSSYKFKKGQSFES